MRKVFFYKIADLIEKRTKLIFFLGLIITLVAVFFAGKIYIKTSFKDLMPQSHSTVKEFNKIIDNYKSASNIIIGAKGNNEEDLKKFVEEITPQIKNIKKFIKRVEHKISSDFLENNAFKLMKEKDLKNAKDMYKDLGILPLLREINNNFERTYVADGEESISNQEKENLAVASLDGIKNWLQTMEFYLKNNNNENKIHAKKAVSKLLIGENYMMSQDKKMILLFAHPNFSVENIDKSTILMKKLDSLILKTSKNYPSIELSGASGTIPLAVEEMEAAYADMNITSLISFVLIIILFIFSFRMLSAPLLAGFSLIIGIVWTAGLIGATIGSLNMMTSMFAVILIGLGIDFNIHVIAAYNENKAKNKNENESLKLAFEKSGNGILMGGITTALAFFTMLVSENAGMKEFGFVAGSGVLLSVLSSIFILPSLLVLRDKIKKKKIKVKNKSEFNLLGNIAEHIYNKPFLYVFATVLVTVFLTYSTSKITFDYDYLSLQPEGLKSIAMQDTILEKFNMTPDMVLITTSDIERAREITKEAKKLKKVALVTSISDFIPSEDEFKKRTPYIKEIASYLENTETQKLTEENFDEFIDEIYRIEDNVIELAQLSFTGGQEKVDKKTKELVGDLEISADERKSLMKNLATKLQENKELSIKYLNNFQNDYEPFFRNLAKKMTSQEKINWKNLPKDISERFISEDKKHFLVTIYPKEQVWNFEFLESFSKQMKKIDEKITGMPLVFIILMDLIAKDGKLAAILTLIIVFLLLMIDFKDFKLSILTLLPLVLGTIWMLGLMQIFGMQLNLMNVMGVPLILGIGIDDGVHILHRYRVEGKYRIKKIFSSTGKAVFITSLTTIMAFGSLGFATSRGLASLGITLAIGIATCFFTTLFVIPSLIGLMEKSYKK